MKPYMTRGRFCLERDYSIGTDLHGVLALNKPHLQLSNLYYRNVEGKPTTNHQVPLFPAYFVW